jgi:metallophosphoesterase superfamily enzyme
VAFHLVVGNHDILSKESYEHLDIQLHQDCLDIAPFSFVHDIKDSKEAAEYFYFCGHLHPGIEIKGKAKQKLRLPCFHFTEQYACLPAFSKFTGISPIKRKQSDCVYMITEEEVVDLSPPVAGCRA